MDNTQADVIAETALRYGKPGGGWPFKDWPLERVQAVYYQVSGLLAENDDRISDTWFEDVAALARVILEERAQDSAVVRRFQKK